MIYTRIHAGLGNQLFQYACGRALSLRRGVPLGIVEPHKFRPDRPLRIWDFTIAGTPIPEGDRPGDVTVLYERPYSFIPAILDAPDGVLLDGLWQSEKYFEDAAGQIYQDLSFRDSGLMDKARAKIMNLRLEAQGPIVGVHIRRGDYTTAATKGFFHNLSLKWFQTAMARFPQHVAFMVVSDDMQWCRDTLAGPRIHFSDGTSDLEDLALLRACDHYIISNSTFGWWGAWLSDNRQAVVIGPGPQAWFTPILLAQIPHDTSNILPSRWVAQPEID